MRWKTVPPSRLLPPPDHPAGPWTSYLHATLWLEPVVWEERVRGHLHLMATETAARAGEPWLVVDVASHPFETWDGGPELPADAGELLAAALLGLELRFYRSEALGAVSHLGEPLAAFRSRVLSSLRPEIQYRMSAGESRGAMAEELAGALAKVGGGFEELAVPLDGSSIRSTSLGIVLVPAGVTLRGPALWDEMVRGPVRGGGRT
ncbi:MAG: hypothetical protein GXP47_12585 [Acidobacteria bacterium]|nr:hypothetical protein [Acidobacteriota bacterium]